MVAEEENSPVAALDQKSEVSTPYCSRAISHMRGPSQVLRTMCVLRTEARNVIVTTSGSPGFDIRLSFFYYFN